MIRLLVISMVWIQRLRRNLLPATKPLLGRLVMCDVFGNKNLNLFKYFSEIVSNLPIGNLKKGSRNPKA